MRKSALLIAAAVTVMAAAPAQGATVRLTATEKANLIYLMEEEKLARDVYNFLATVTPTQKFTNIAASEQHHMDTIAALLKTYGIADPTKGRAPGSFKNATLANLYKTLTAAGSADYASAMQAGITIETLDITDLKTDLTQTKRADIISALNLLLQASEKHLAAFSR